MVMTTIERHIKAVRGDSSDENSAVAHERACFVDAVFHHIK